MYFFPNFIIIHKNLIIPINFIFTTFFKTKNTIHYISSKSFTITKVHLKEHFLLQFLYCFTITNFIKFVHNTSITITLYNTTIMTNISPLITISSFRITFRSTNLNNSVISVFRICFF